MAEIQNIFTDKTNLTVQKKSMIPLTFQSLAFSVCTTSLKVKKFYILPTEYLFVLYVLVSQKKTKFVLYSTQRLVFITEETSVYRAIRTGSLNKTHQISSLNGYCPNSIQILIYFLRHRYIVSVYYNGRLVRAAVKLQQFIIKILPKLLRRYVKKLYLTYVKESSTCSTYCDMKR